MIEEIAWFPAGGGVFGCALSRNQALTSLRSRRVVKSIIRPYVSTVIIESKKTGPTIRRDMAHHTYIFMDEGWLPRTHEGLWMTLRGNFEKNADKFYRQSEENMKKI